MPTINGVRKVIVVILVLFIFIILGLAEADNTKKLFRWTTYHANMTLFLHEIKRTTL
ncbi:hypothetical protein QWZ13_09970 [Reinekea marina]|uniref:hypothetical protein n=1 Tax=Reinekea marina TaxID=1310421 RepID=UPI0025B4E879|nr:hypothetical protein [Reinekea marina]MDN3649238.1 hypothetical protein [Reinekea marina]